MNKPVIIIGGIAMLAIGVVIGFFVSKTHDSVPANSLSPIISITDTQTATMISSKTQSDELVKVTRVIDGDTIEIEGGERVRYIGIDTPETVDPRKSIQCFGVEASKKNKELVEGKMVRLEKDITDRDKYHRLLRYVWLGDTLINLSLVEQGFAHSYSYPPDIKLQDQFVAAERQAREAKIGFWNTCQQATSSVIISTPVSAPAGNGSCTIKGNISASGEKIYHMSGCGSYDKTRIDASHGERWFCSENEAQTAGWRKALNCP